MYYTFRFIRFAGYTSKCQQIKNVIRDSVEYWIRMKVSVPTKEIFVPT